MAQHFLLHLPDGTQYGPIDRETLEAWRAEGRIPDETLVWPEGAPEWIAITQGLGARPAPAPGTSDPARAPPPAPAPVPAPVPATAVRPAPTPEPTSKAAAPAKAAP